MIDLSGQVVLITGASKGIGREIAYAFSREKCKVILTYNSDEAGGEETALMCEELGASDVYFLCLDVMNLDSIKNALRELIDKYGGIDILVNNAGIIVWNSFSKQTYEEISAQIASNITGLLNVTKAFLPFTNETIINIGSQSGKTGYPNIAPYCATKFAIRGFTESIASEIRQTVYCVNPDMTKTQMTDFQGRHPREVAKVVVNAAKGVYDLPSGSDIDVWDVIE